MNLFKLLAPPKRWRIPVIIALGTFIGIGFFAAYEGNALSYLSDDPKTCINCHVMNPQYATWRRSSHREHATCNDCHVPQDNVINKYCFKAMDGLRHSTIFTMRGEVEAITIKEAGKKAVQANCVRCHENLNSQTIHQVDDQGLVAGKLCWECHRHVPHGTVRSLSATADETLPPDSYDLKEMLKTKNEK